MASLDNIYVTASLFGLAIILLATTVVWNAVADIDIFDETSVGQNVEVRGQNFFDNLDTFFVFVFFALHLGILILAYALRSHPIVYVAGIILVAMLALVSAPLSNAYDTTIASTTELSTAATGFSTMGYLMNNLPKISVVFGFITIIILAGLARNEGII